MNASSLSLLGGAFFLAALATAAVVPLVSALARRLGAVAKPGGRHVHRGEIPRLGGLSLALGLALGCLAYAGYAGLPALAALLGKGTFQAFVLPWALVFLVGVLDDVRGLSPAPRVVFEALAATVLMQSGLVLDAVATPWGPLNLGLAAFPLTLLWFVGVTNAFNLIDGLDGLLPTVGISTFLGCGAVAWLAGMAPTAVLSVALAGSLLGFLYWNRHPARAFLGDSGSLLVGFAAAALTLKASRNLAGAVSLHIAVALCALPIAETFLTLARRHLSGVPYFVGDRSHIHHVLLDRGWSVPRAVAVLGGASFLFAASAVLSRRYTHQGYLALLVLCLLAAAGALRWLGYVELRLLRDRLLRGLFRRGPRGIPEVLALIRAGDLLRRATDPDGLKQRLAEAAVEARVHFLAWEPSDEALRRVTDRTVVQRRSSSSSRRLYLETRGQRPVWLFAGAPAAEEAEALGEEQLAVAVPPGDGRFGRLVVHRLLREGQGVPSVHDVRDYLAHPLAEAVEGLRPAASADADPAKRNLPLETAPSGGSAKEER